MSQSVSAIWRYPVKSMQGEQLDAAEIGERGLAGDRAYALIDVESGYVASAKNPRRWGMLFECRAEYLEPPEPAGDPPPVRITLPDGTTVQSNDPDVDRALSRVVGRDVRLEAAAPAQPTYEDFVPDIEGSKPELRGTVKLAQLALLAPGTFFDAAPVHVVTTSSLDALAAAYPSGRFDARRFRPNVLIDTGASDAGGYVENAWVDQSLRIGDRVALHVVLAAPRCVMTTLAQPDLPADKGVLQTIARENRFDIPGLGPSSCVGVYGLVSAGGRVAVGDPAGVEPL